MIDFTQAITYAEQALNELQCGAVGIRLESALISEARDVYEIVFSYYLSDTDDQFEVQNGDAEAVSNLRELLNIMRMRRIYKTFLIDINDGSFRGFRHYKEALDAR